MKKFRIITLISLILIFTLSLSCLAATFDATLSYDGAAHNYSGTYFTVRIDGETVDAPIPPIVLENGRSLVCLREIFEKTGAKVAWFEKEQRVVVSSKSTSVSVIIGSTQARVNGESVTMETAPRLVAYNGIGKTMVPIRFIAEALNMTVDFDSAENIIDITPSKSTPMPTPRPTPAPTPTEDGETEKIYAIDFTADETKDSLTVKISFDAPVTSYSDFTLDNPNRVVIDISNAVSDLGTDAFEFSGNVTKMRTGIHEDKLRIVFDAGEMPDFDISLSSKEKVMTIKLNSSGLSLSPSPEPDIPDDDDKEDEDKDIPINSAPIVVIDAGHGGSDVGAIGYNEDGTVAAYEKDITLAVSNKVIDILRQNGVNVRYTRNTDETVSLSDRANFANKIEASLFVSIHCNAYTTTDINGSLVMYHTTKDTSEYGVSGKELATNILTPLVKALDTYNRDLMKGDTMYVIRMVDMPSVIVETAFITNEKDRAKLTDEDYQDRMALAIAEGIIKTLENVIK